ncbi:hypothetical protein GR702_18725 [Novosphingobium sp. FGD1]|jgi:O-antigen ligase|uniref:O-antigen ligase-related domain-containing protein n=1 Tax=Novosphingobium silvae TaxID=2692619 RepID=A0A7X4GLB3_9SPHN|nr:O-antigen ligase family protein [Novosphingobium silvae]MYL99797.1 hypothetical protein [Novosphingobium silvae]
MMAITAGRSRRHGPGSWSMHSRLLACLIAAAAVLGGSAATNPLRDLAMELLALGLLASAAFLRREAGHGPQRWTVVLLACLVLVPVLQIIPLPPGTWQSLPGRSLVIEIANAVLPGDWRPVTFDGPATQQWLIGLSVPVAAFLLARGLRDDEGEYLLWAVVAVGCASAVLGLVQLATGQLHLYVSAHNNFPVGLFANRNHQAMMMALTLAVTLLLAVRRVSTGQLGVLAWVHLPIALLVIAVALLTQSRAGAVLLALGVLPAAIMLRRTATRAMALGGLVLIGLGAAWLLLSGSGQGILSRMMQAGGDERFMSFDDVWFMVTYHFPFGTGLGTFARAFLPVESLSTVSGTYLNHAHCDYLELVAEAGVLGIVAIAAALWGVLIAFLRVLRLPATGEHTLVSVAALTTIVLVMVHSLADYPARTFLIGAIAAAMAGVLTRLPGRASEMSPQQAGPLPRAVQIAAALLMVAGGVQAVRLALSSIGVGQEGAVRPLGPPVTSDAHGQLAEAALATGDLAEAQHQSRAALKAAAYNSRALQILGEVALAQGEAARAVELLNLSARVTWRNTDVQWWKLRQSLQEGSLDAALNSGDALLRRARFVPETRAAFLALAANPDARVLLAERVAEDNPPWSATLMSMLAKAGPERTPEMLAFVQEAMKRGYRPEDARLRVLFDRAFARGEGAPVADLARIANPSVPLDPAKGVVDADFGRVAANRPLWGPFGWRIGDEGAYFDDAQTSGEGRLLRVGRTGGGDVLSQRLLLPAGSWELHASGAIEGGAEGRVRWRIECADPGNVDRRRQLGRLEIGGGEDRAGAARFSVPAGCPSQMLALEVLSESDVDIALGKVTVRRTGG